MSHVIGMTDHVIVAGSHVIRYRVKSWSMARMCLLCVLKGREKHSCVDHASQCPCLHRACAGLCGT